MEQFYENGVLITPMSEEDQRYTKIFFETCKKYNINFAKADEMERNFVMERTEYLLQNAS